MRWQTALKRRNRGRYSPACDHLTEATSSASKATKSNVGDGDSWTKRSICHLRDRVGNVAFERLGMQKKGGLTRTYGTCQVYINGNPEDGLAGHMCETVSPGDNSKKYLQIPANSGRAISSQSGGSQVAMRRVLPMALSSSYQRSHLQDLPKRGESLQPTWLHGLRRLGWAMAW